ncbi:hypothetical protein HRG84_17725 [Flavisolibacter sp. BT320]|nr:hypothetical protein [Flavisolibacter longurius]
MGLFESLFGSNNKKEDREASQFVDEALSLQAQRQRVFTKFNDDLLIINHPRKLSQEKYTELLKASGRSYSSFGARSVSFDHTIVLPAEVNMNGRPIRAKVQTTFAKDDTLSNQFLMFDSFAQSSAITLYEFFLTYGGWTPVNGVTGHESNYSNAVQLLSEDCRIILTLSPLDDGRTITFKFL